MASTIIEIKPRKAEFDPLAHQVQSSLLEFGEDKANAQVHTERLYRIEGDFDQKQMESIVNDLLVDPVVETGHIETNEKNGKKKSAKGVTLDVWPKAGVTDPVGETVEKGLQDLGFQGEHKAASATRYIFPKLTDAKKVRTFALQFLANELIHDVRVH